MNLTAAEIAKIKGFYAPVIDFGGAGVEMASIDQPINFIDTSPKPIDLQIELHDYFQRIKRLRASAWQVDLCRRLQDAAVNRHIVRWWGIINAEGQAND